MKIHKVYIAGDYSANNTIKTLQNIGKGEKAAAQLFDMGFAPFCPWHDKSYAMELCDKELEVSKFYNASLAWLEVSDAVFVISGRGNGGGVDAEIKRAIELKIPVFDSLVCLKRWGKITKGDK